MALADPIRREVLAVLARDRGATRHLSREASSSPARRWPNTWQYLTAPDWYVPTGSDAGSATKVTCNH